MGNVQFESVERGNTPIKILASGLAGAGKTLSMLIMAQRMAELEAWRAGRSDGGRVCLISTEGPRDSAYVDSVHLPTGFRWQRVLLKNPYHPSRFMEAIAACEGNFDAVVIDSITHIWKGPGGILDEQKKEQNKMSGGHAGMRAWDRINRTLYNPLMARIQNTSLNLFVTVRTKFNKTTKMEEIEFRDGIEYEYLVHFRLDKTHKATSMRDNTNQFDLGGGRKRVGVISRTYSDFLFLWKYQLDPQTTVLPSSVGSPTPPPSDSSLAAFQPAQQQQALSNPPVGPDQNQAAGSDVDPSEDLFT